MLILFLAPVFVSAIVGVVFVVLGEARPASKIAVIVVFALAAYLQFLTRHSLAGMLLQIGLALFLLIWKRFDSAS